MAKDENCKLFYVSLVYDLLSCYLVFEAESETAVRQYLAKEYLNRRTGEWKLPWCSIYKTYPTEPGALVIKAKCGCLREEVPIGKS